MDEIDLCIIILFFIVLVIIIFCAVIASDITSDIGNKIDEIQQYNCAVINSEMKLDQSQYVSDALENEWFKKECWKVGEDYITSENKK